MPRSLSRLLRFSIKDEQGNEAHIRYRRSSNIPRRMDSSKYLCSRMGQIARWGLCLLYRYGMYVQRLYVQ